MSKITFAEDAWEKYLYWQLQDKKTLKKINSLLKAMKTLFRLDKGGGHYA